MYGSIVCLCMHEYFCGAEKLKPWYVRYPGGIQVSMGHFRASWLKNGCFEGFKWSIYTQRRTLVRTHPTGPLLLSEAAMKSKRQESKAVKTLRKMFVMEKRYQKPTPPSCYEPVKAWSQAIKCLKRNTLLATEFPPQSPVTSQHLRCQSG